MLDARIKITQADITTLDLDAIVTAANAALAGGGGVDGAIHRAAGPQLLAACQQIGSCRTGETCITPGFDLKARHVIHAVGPIYADYHSERAADLLSSTYKHALYLAIENGVKTIAFPAISTGIYGYPFEEATRIALGTVHTFLTADPEHRIEAVHLVFFSDEDFAAATATCEQWSD